MMPKEKVLDERFAFKITSRRCYRRSAILLFSLLTVYSLLGEKVRELSPLVKITPISLNLNNSKFDSSREDELKSTIREDIPTWFKLYKPTSSANELDNQNFDSNSENPRIWPREFLKEFQSNGNAQYKHKYEHDLPSHIWTNNQPHNSKAGSCKPYKEWFWNSFPTCNILHEVDFSTGVVRGCDKNDHDEKNNERIDLRIDYLFAGKSREAWKLNMTNFKARENNDTARNTPHNNLGLPTVIKTIKFEHVYSEHMYEHQRLDALVTEHFTSSPHIVNIYGFCGGSVINEYADGGDLKQFFENRTETITPMQQLTFARDAALGLADIHGVDGEGHISTLVHHDVKPTNFLVVGGKLKLHDFNNAGFLKWNFKKNETCGFHFKEFCNYVKTKTNRRPIDVQECTEEEDMVTEKVEVFRLGFTFLYLLEARNYLVEANGSQSRYEVTSISESHSNKSMRLNLPKHLIEIEDPIVKIIMKAAMRMFTYRTEERPSARMIAEALVNATLDIQSKPQR